MMTWLGLPSPDLDHIQVSNMHGYICLCSGSWCNVEPLTL